MSRENQQASIVSEEQLVPSAHRLIIKKNNQRVASDSNITNTLLKLVVGILRHHKLYKPVFLTATVPMSPPVTNKPYTKPPIEKQIRTLIKTLGYNEDQIAKMTFVSTFVATKLRQPWRVILSVLNRSLTRKESSWDTARLLILQILWGIVHSANLDYTSLIWDEFDWQAVDRTSRPSKMSKLIYTRFTKLIIDHFLSCNKSITRRSDAEMHSEGQDLPITKLINTKEESEKGKVVEEPKEKHVSPVKSRRGKGYMRLGDQKVNVPKVFKKNVLPRKQRSITFADNLVPQEYVAVELAKSVSIEDQRLQQHDIMTQLTIDRQIVTPPVLNSSGS
ncbi:hypothetical protein Tco_0393636 [Tanacetum coccineum]